MKELATAPELVSLRTLADTHKDVYELHAHPFCEFTLVTDGSAQIAYPPGWRDAPPSTLFFYHRGERHGARIVNRQKPNFWVIHFSVGDAYLNQIETLAEPDPEKRVWKLNSDQVNSFRWIFFHLMNERNSKQVLQEASTSAWLQLLLVNVQRWTHKAMIPEVHSSSRASPEVQRLWQSIVDCVNKPFAQSNNIFKMPNYDSIRHAFKKSFGCSPREMLIRLRMEQARNLLLETNLSIKEISERTGYGRQHEFYRAFRRHTGCSPSEWRENSSTIQQADHPSG